MKRSLLLLSLVIVIGCRPPQIATSNQSTSIDYSIIYLIHGDANYLYHNADGKALQADEHVLEEAQKVGRQATNGEVFIFHQQPESKILWLFPKKDRRFLHYKNGRLVRQQRYSPKSAAKAFAAEAERYQNYSSAGTLFNGQRFFLYFGHEIPERAGQSYHDSRPKAPLYTQLFAQGMASFLQTGSFDLAVLSTCNNGTPSMIHALAAHTQMVLASPKNLHLSHIDSGTLPKLLQESNPNTADIARSLAQNTYQRLSSFLQTSITLGLYETNKMVNYLPALAEQYNQHLSTLDNTTYGMENIDCNALPFFTSVGDTAGVELWYKAPQFGQKPGTKEFESGWGCKINKK